MKKIIFIILGVCILFAFTACSVNSSQRNSISSTITKNNMSSDSNQKTFSYSGDNYPINVLPDFEVRSMIYENDTDNTCSVGFISVDNIDDIDDISEESFLNGLEFIEYYYNCRYDDLFRGDAKILGSAKYVFTGAFSDTSNNLLNAGYIILYSPSGDIIFKTDVDMTLECGLHKIYYDNNDNIIAKYFSYDKTNEKCLFEKPDGTIINEDELELLLEGLCPNEFLKDFV